MASGDALETADVGVDFLNLLAVARAFARTGVIRDVRKVGFIRELAVGRSAVADEKRIARHHRSSQALEGWSFEIGQQMIGCVAVPIPYDERRSVVIARSSGLAGVPHDLAPDRYLFMRRDCSGFEPLPNVGSARTRFSGLLRPARAMCR